MSIRSPTSTLGQTTRSTGDNGTASVLGAVQLLSGSSALLAAEKDSLPSANSTSKTLCGTTKTHKTRALSVVAKRLIQTAFLLLLGAQETRYQVAKT
jgi:hypothetical protein